MAYLLNVAYLLLVVLAFPWLLYGATKKGKYREGWGAKLLGRAPIRIGNRRCIWLHAVSVGEVQLLQTLLPRIERAHPDCECLISTTTKTGYKLASEKYAPRTVFYCPLDFTWAVREAVRRVRPDLLVLTELELWPNLIAAAKAGGAKVAVVNGRLSEKSFRGYRRLRRLVGTLFKSLDLVAAQDEEYAVRFRELGALPPAVQVTGSLKYDGAATNRENTSTRRLTALAGIQPEDTVFLAGSTQQPEEQLAIEVYRKLATESPNLRLILVPRHPERFSEVAALLDRLGLSWQRRSELENRGEQPDERPTDSVPRILLVDAIGELAAWWGTAHIAFVGGSLGRRGGQNMLEPAAYGAAVSFGPNTWNFREIVAQLLAADAARVVHGGEELTAFVQKCLAEPDFTESLGRRARSLVERQLGAADRTVALLSELISPPCIEEHNLKAA